MVSVITAEKNLIKILNQSKMKKSALFAAFVMNVFFAIAQITPPAPPSEPVPPSPPAPPGYPSVNIDDDKVTIIDAGGNVFIVDDYGVRKNGALIIGDSEDLRDAIDDLQEEIEDIRDEASSVSPGSDAYIDLMDDLADLEDELAELQDESYAYRYESPDTLPDSTTITVGPWRLTVREGENVSFDRVEGEDDDETQVADDRYVDPFETKWFLFDLGYNTYLDANHDVNVPEPYSVMEDQQTWGSWDVNVHLFRQRLNIAHGYLNLNWGLSFEWHNFRYNSDFKILPQMDSLTISYFDAEGVPYDFKKSRFSTTHFTIPVILGFETKPWDTDHSFRMGFGYSPGLMVKGKTKIVVGGDTQKVKDDFNLAPFRHELNYSIGYGGLNLYASYDINGMFREGQGPELHPFSVGLIINRGF